MTQTNALIPSRPFGGLPAMRHAMLPPPFRHPMR
jgi:hypothetical protein